jgi:hypothetical protein
MKVLITENKLFDLIYSYIDGDFDKDNISWVYGMDDGEDGDLVDYKENKNFLIFFNGDWEGEEDSDVIFYYLDVEYYSDEPSSQSWKQKSPILEVSREYGDLLDSMFGGRWKEPMKIWFEDKFKLPVKTVTIE